MADFEEMAISEIRFSVEIEYKPKNRKKLSQKSISAISAISFCVKITVPINRKFSKQPN